MPKPTPNWQPLSMLPTLANMVSGMLSEVETQLPNLRTAQTKPHVMDNHTVERVLKVYSEQQDFIWAYEVQLERWQQERLTAPQRQQLAQMTSNLAQFQSGLSEILEIANELKGKTIEAIVLQDDAALLQDVLSGNIPSPS